MCARGPPPLWREAREKEKRLEEERTISKCIEAEGDNAVKVSKIFRGKKYTEPIQSGDTESCSNVSHHVWEGL